MNDPVTIDAETARQAREWVRVLASGEAATGDVAAIRQWLEAAPQNARAFERERAFWQDMEPHRALFAARPRNGNAFAQAPRRAGMWRPRIGRRGLAAAVAACASVAMVAPEAMLRLQADHAAATGKIKALTLPDGSTAVLDSGSAIAVAYDGSQRGVTPLRGRAWFTVAHGDARPFRVAAAGGVTQDIGTAFEVARIDDDSAGVAVSEGAVAVSGTSGAPTRRLTAGQRVSYDDGKLGTTGAIRTDRIAAWRHGELLIDRLPLAQAIDEVARYRSGPVLLLAGADARPRVSGVFRTDRPDDALAALAAGAGLRLSRLPGGVVLIR